MKHQPQRKQERGARQRLSRDDMITIKYKESKNGFRVDLEGHANSSYGEIGKDSVCAVISGLTATLARKVSDAENAGLLTDNAVINLGENGCGVGRVSCRVDRKYHSAMKLIYDFAVTGYMLMAYNFPNEVKFTRS